MAQASTNNANTLTLWFLFSRVGLKIEALQKYLIEPKQTLNGNWHDLKK